MPTRAARLPAAEPIDTGNDAGAPSRSRCMGIDRSIVSAHSPHGEHTKLTSPRRVAVIGAGLSGLMCARTLAVRGVQVTVFEKSRGVGGRCATRREGAWQFDHGAQYFTVRDARLEGLLRAWAAEGLVAPWRGRIAVRDGGAWRDESTGATGVRERWVAVPGMSALGKALATGLEVRLSSQVARMEDRGARPSASTASDQNTGRWQLLDPEGVVLGAFDAVLVAVPSPQASALLAGAAPAIAGQAAQAVMHPTWATLLVFDAPLRLPFDGVFVNDDPVLGWVARNDGKPGRSGAESFVLHANRRWSREHLEDAADQVALEMTEAFSALVHGITDSNTGERAAHSRWHEPLFRTAHRWRYAIADPVLATGALYDPVLSLGAAGDWCGGPRIEGALLSGLALAGQVLAMTGDVGDGEQASRGASGVARD